MQIRNTSPSPQRVDVDQAAEDLRCRTLGKIPRPLDRMILLASMRDYNTGLYYHEGLAAHFTPETASEAIACCHREAFQQLVGCPLRDLVGQLEAYQASVAADAREFLAAWKGLEPYRVTIPAESGALAADLLHSNFKIALAVLEARLQTRLRESGASPPLPPGPRFPPPRDTRTA